jgi:hypothetical protein
MALIVNHALRLQTVQQQQYVAKLTHGGIESTSTSSIVTCNPPSFAQAIPSYAAGDEAAFVMAVSTTDCSPLS